MTITLTSGPATILAAGYAVSYCQNPIEIRLEKEAVTIRISWQPFSESHQPSYKVQTDNAQRLVCVTVESRDLGLDIGLDIGHPEHLFKLFYDDASAQEVYLTFQIGPVLKFREFSLLYSVFSLPSPPTPQPES